MLYLDKTLSEVSGHFEFKLLISLIVDFSTIEILIGIQLFLKKLIVYTTPGEK